MTCLMSDINRVNMADSGVAARREARRRRILENSEDRLQKIFANQSNIKSVPSSVSNNIKEALASEEGSDATPVGHAVNGLAPKKSLPSVSFSANHNIVNDGEISPDVLANQLLSNLHELLQNSSIPSSDDVASPETESKIASPNFQHYKRLRAICLALFVRLALAFDLGYLFGEVLLVPFLVTELSAQLLLENAPTPSAGSSILQLVLLLGGIVPSRAAVIIKIFNETSTLMQNLCIYLFTFVLCHAFIDWPG